MHTSCPHACDNMHMTKYMYHRLQPHVDCMRVSLTESIALITKGLSKTTHLTFVADVNNLHKQQAAWHSLMPQMAGVSGARSLASSSRKIRVWWCRSGTGISLIQPSSSSFLYTVRDLRKRPVKWDQRDESQQVDAPAMASIALLHQ